MTNDLLNNYDAVNLVKTSSEILGGKGGGGRKDMALAGAKDVSKSEDVFEQLLKKSKKILKTFQIEDLYQFYQ